MNFEFSEEQTMIRDTLARLIRDEYVFDARHAAIESDSGWRPEFWAQLAQLGILSAPFSEDDGGFGGGPVETLVIMEEIGKGLVVEPFVPSVVCAGGFLKHAGTAGTEGRASRRDHRRQPRVRFCAWRTPRPLRHGVSGNSREKGWRRLCAERLQGRRHRRALGLAFYRHRAHLGRRRRA